MLVGNPAWAADPAARAARARQAEQRIAKLEERLEQTQAEDAAAQAQLKFARAHAELARKLLQRNNERAAQAIVEAAERFLALAEQMQAARR
jgi:hypothetical protein